MSYSQWYLWHLNLDQYDERKRFLLAWSVFSSHNYFIVFEVKNAKVRRETTKEIKSLRKKNGYLIHAWTYKAF